MEKQAAGLRKEIPIDLKWGDLHPGVLEWVKLKNGWPSYYRTPGEMPAETALVFDYMLRTEVAAKKSDSMLEAVAAAQQATWRELLKR